MVKSISICCSLILAFVSFSFIGCSEKKVPEQKTAIVEKQSVPTPIVAETVQEPEIQKEPATDTAHVQQASVPIVSVKHKALSDSPRKNVTNQQESVREKAEIVSVPPIMVSIDLPPMAEPNDTILIDASKSKDPADNNAALSFRFDVDGDGVWDYPASGFTKEQLYPHVYTKEGLYKVIVEAQGNNNRTSLGQSKIMVRIPPSATIDIHPTLPTAGSICTLDAQKSTVSSLGSKSFVARWDLDNNGSWDSPAQGAFSSTLIALKKLTGAGPYRVVLQIKDEAGLTSKAVAEIPMTPVFKVILVSLPDTALTDVSFFATCQTSYPPFEIAEYDWDFNGDGVFEKKEEKLSIPYEFSKAGTYKVSCKAIARNGNMSTGTRSIVVVARSVILKCKVPKQAQALIPVEFDGTANARHTKIEQFSWDYDGDGIFDWSGTSVIKTKHAFSKAGTFHPVLRAITMDKHEWYDTGSIIVSQAVGPLAIAGKSVLANKNDNVELIGKGVVSTGTVILYEWDFDNNGVYDWKSEKTGTVHHVFVDYTRVVLRVTAESGLTATDTTTIVICPSGMVGVQQGPFCIDKYEYPNAKDQVPVREVTYADAVQQCKKENKHLCTSDEWERACSGNDKSDYPKSSSQYALQPCNVLTTKGDASHVFQSGSFPDCVTQAGAFDMNGNVAEWTATQKGDVAFVYGGSWLFPQENAGCGSKMELKAGKGYPYVGFRCCK